MAKPLIVGIDIGTTTGLAIYDLKRNLLFLDSKRNFSIPDIIKKITLFGRPLIISTDKKNVPAPINKIAASFNTKVFHPDHDLSIEEKETLVKISMKDEHQRDALATVLFAYKFYAVQFNTIDRNLEALGLKEYSNRVKEMIIRKEAKNIAEAIEKIKPKEEKIEKKETPKEVKINWEERAKELERKLKDEEKSHEISKMYIEKLENRVRNLELQKEKYIEEEMRKNEEARKQVLKDREIKTRDILVNQLKFELSKQKSFKKAYEEEMDRKQELINIANDKLVPVFIIPEFNKETIINVNREFDIENKIVWIKNFKSSKVSTNVLASTRPKVVIGELDEETKENLNKSRIIVVDTVKPEIRKYYAAISPAKIENEIKKVERTDFLKWLEDYKRR